METITQAPSFNVSLRGYDREEVDEYLDSLAEALGHVEDAEEQNRRLQSHINRLNARVKDLEDQLRECTPKTGVALGDRVGSILTEAEEAAAEIVRSASDKAAEADQIVSSASARGEEEAQRIVATARIEAHDIVTEAEARAAARTRQIEQWADQVISHARAEEARMLREQQERSAAAAAEFEALADKKRAAAATLTLLRESLGAAVDIVGEPVLPEPVPVPEPVGVDTSAHPAGAGGEDAIDLTGGGLRVVQDRDDDLEDWVSGPPDPGKS